MKTRVMSTTAAMIAGLLATMIAPPLVWSGDSIPGTGVTVTDVAVNTGAKCFKQAIH